MQYLIGDARYTRVLVNDEPNEVSKACHSYTIVDQESFAAGLTPKFQIEIDFQKGPIKEAGVNGCHGEDLLAIVLHRLEGFQSSAFKCKENACAITHIEEALMWLNKRTKTREAKGIEGTHIVDRCEGPEGTFNTTIAVLPAIEFTVGVDLSEKSAGEGSESYTPFYKD